MPQDDLYLPSSIISKLFAQVPQSLPKSSLTIDDAQRNKVVKQQQQKVIDERKQMPWGEQFMRGLVAAPTATLLDVVGNLSNEFTGKNEETVPRDENGWSPYNIGSDIGSLGVQAGIPFPTGKKVFHGTTHLNKIADEGFNMKLNDRDDTMGWMIHAAERPEYANSYADSMKGTAFNHTSDARKGILPLTSNAENMFDTFNPTSEDMARLISAVSDRQDRYGQSKRRILIDAWKKNQKDVTRGSPIRDILNYITPEEFSRTGFDAVKYPDVGEVSYAFPDPSKTLNAYTKQPIGGKGVMNVGPFDKEIPLEGNSGVLLRKDDPWKVEIKSDDSGLGWDWSGMPKPKSPAAGKMPGEPYMESLKNSLLKEATPMSTLAKKFKNGDITYDEHKELIKWVMANHPSSKKLSDKSIGLKSKPFNDFSPADINKLMEYADVQGINYHSSEPLNLLKKLSEHSHKNSKYWHPIDLTKISELESKYGIK